MKKILIAIFILLFAGSGWGATYYVCDGGNASAPTDGTCGNAYADIEDCLDAQDLGADDVIALAGNVTEDDVISWGTADSGTGVDDYVTLDGNGYILTLAGDGNHGIQLTAASYVYIKDIIITGITTDSMGAIALKNDSDYIVIDNVEIYDGVSGDNTNGIVIRGDTGEAPDYVEIKDSIFRNLNKGIAITSSVTGRTAPTYIHVYNNTIYDMDEGLASIADGIACYDEAGAVALNITGSVFEYNDIHNTPDQAIDVTSCGDVTMRYNLIYDTGIAGDGQGIKLGDTATNPVGENIYVYGNVIHDTESSGIYYGEASPWIYNNTFYNIGGEAIRTDSTAYATMPVGSADGVYIYNNIIHTANACFGLSINNGNTRFIDNNLCYNFATYAAKIAGSQYDTWGDYTTAINAAIVGAGTHSVNVDPLFTNAGGDDFSLTNGSPGCYGAFDIRSLDTDLFDKTGGSGGVGDKGEFVLTDLRLAELSSGNLTVGNMYEISARTGADFTTDGSPDNVVGTTFIANSTNVTLDADDKVYPIDISWDNTGTNLVEIDSDALHITYVNDTQGAFIYFNSDELTSNLVVGETYRVTGISKAVGSVRIKVENDTDPWVAIDSATFVPFEIDFLCDSVNTNGLRFTYFGAGEEIWIDSLKIQKITGYLNHTRLDPTSVWPDDVRTMGSTEEIGAYGCYKGARLAQ